jgi:hypothetical protein
MYITLHPPRQRHAYIEIWHIDIEKSHAHILSVCGKQVPSLMSEHILHASILKRLGRRSLEFHTGRVVHRLALYKLEIVLVYVKIVIAFLKAASSKRCPLISLRFDLIQLVDIVIVDVKVDQRG